MHALRYWIALVESKDSTYENMQGEPVQIYRNPTKAEVNGLIRRAHYDGYLRGVMLDGEIYLWDGGLATHFEIADHLGVGLQDCYGLEIEHGTVTYLYNSMMHSEIDPNDVVDELEKYPAFRTMTVVMRPWRN